MLTATTTFVYLAAGLQLTQYPMMRLIQKKLDVRAQLDALAPVPRYLVTAITAGVVLYVGGTAVVAVFAAGELLSTRLGLALCLLQSLVWLVRTAQQVFLVRRQWPSHASGVFWTVTSIYASLATLYTWFWCSGVFVGGA